MADPAKPQTNNIVKFFIPGLALGILIGGVAGAFIYPRFENPGFPDMPKATVKRGPAPNPTGPTGDTGSTAPEQRQPETPPSGTPK